MKISQEPITSDEEGGARQRRVNLLLVVVSLTLSLLAAELILRIALPRNEIVVGTLRAPNAALYGWALFPNAKDAHVNPDTREVSVYYTNSQGWKDVEHTFSKPDSVFRILFLGDSHTYGIVPLEDVYTRQVEKKLKQEGYPHVEVISIGIGSWGTDQELEALKLEGVRYHPDIVVYQFSGNDLRDNLLPRDNIQMNFIDRVSLSKPFRYDVVHGNLRRIDLQPETQKPPSAARRIKDFLLRSALVYHINLAKQRATHYFNTTGQPKDEATETETTEAESRPWWDFNPHNPTRPDFMYKMDDGKPHREAEWELMELLLLEMNAVAEAHGAAFVVFSEAGDEGRRQWNLAWNRIQTDGQMDYVVWEGKRYPIDMNRPLKGLKEVTQRHRIPLISPQRTYTRYQNDPHANKEGNERMADDIVDFLLSREDLFTREKISDAPQ